MNNKRVSGFWALIRRYLVQISYITHTKPKYEKQNEQTAIATHSKAILTATAYLIMDTDHGCYYALLRRVNL